MGNCLSGGTPTSGRKRNSRSTASRKKCRGTFDQPDANGASSSHTEEPMTKPKERLTMTDLSAAKEENWSELKAEMPTAPTGSSHWSHEDHQEESGESEEVIEIFPDSDQPNMGTTLSATGVSTRAGTERSGDECDVHSEGTPHRGAVNPCFTPRPRPALESQPEGFVECPPTCVLPTPTVLNSGVEKTQPLQDWLSAHGRDGSDTKSTSATSVGPTSSSVPGLPGSCHSESYVMDFDVN